MQVKILKSLTYPIFDRRGLMQGSEQLETGAVRDWPARYAAGEIQAGNVEAAAVTPKQPEAQPAPIDATDSARELAELNGIDLATVTGTGTGGRILKSDVEALING